MARPLFTAEQVYAAADAIAGQGKDVTALTLLSRLGGGSLTTIYKHLIAWRESQHQESVTAAKEIPEAVQSAFTFSLSTAWKVATSEATKEVVATKEKAAEQVQFANKQFEEAMQAIERLEEQTDKDAAKIASLTGRVGELEVALQKSENERSAFQATTEQLRHQVKSLEIELERVHRDSESERRRHQDEMERIRSAAAAAQDSANTQINEMRHALSEAKHKGDRAELDRNDAHDRHEKAERRIEQLQEEVRAARHDRDGAVKEASLARGQAEALKEQNSELLARVAGRGKGGKA